MRKLLILVALGLFASRGQLSAAGLAPLYESSGAVDWERLEQADPVDPGEGPPLAEPVQDPANDKGSYGGTIEGSKEAEAARKNTPPSPVQRMVVHVFMRPGKGVGVGPEFVVGTLDGEIRVVGLASTGVAKDSKGVNRTTPVYNILGSVEYRSGVATTEKALRRHYYSEANPFALSEDWVAPYPFHESSHPDWRGSPMYWGLAVKVSDGIWIHSTPHSRHLGRPASMGCIRVSFPTAMELWDLAVNEARGSVRVIVHKPGAESALQAYRALNIDPSKLKNRLDRDYADANQNTDQSGDFNGNIQARKGRDIKEPTCAREDCFEFFGRKRKSK